MPNEEEETEPMWQKLRGIRHRIMFARLTGRRANDVVTETELEGSVEDMRELGEVERLLNGNYRIASLETLTRVGEDVAWWLENLLAVIDQLRSKQAEED